MSSQSILPPRPQPLEAWAKQNLTAVITAKNDDEFNAAFDEFISKHVRTIVFNGVSQTREQYKNQLRKDRKELIKPTINILEAVQAPKLDDQEAQFTGVVGLFYRATRHIVDHPGHGSQPAIIVLTSSLNIEVENDRGVPGPVFEERRRVFALNQVEV